MLRSKFRIFETVSLLMAGVIADGVNLTFNKLFILLVDNVSVSKWKTGDNQTYLHDISCCTKLFRSNISDRKLVSVMEVLPMKENFF